MLAGLTQAGPLQLVYENGDIKLELDNLKGEIQPKASSYRVGKVKVEVKLVKAAPIQWKTLQADDSKPDGAFLLYTSFRPHFDKHFHIGKFHLLLQYKKQRQRTKRETIKRRKLRKGRIGIKSQPTSSPKRNPSRPPKTRMPEATMLQTSSSSSCSPVLTTTRKRP